MRPYSVVISRSFEFEVANKCVWSPVVRHAMVLGEEESEVIEIYEHDRTAGTFRIVQERSAHLVAELVG